jgi:HEPN domain-containing protein
MTEDRSRDWLSQAENDVAFARHGLAQGFYAQVCFLAQQAAEKALKSMAYRRGALAIKSHSLVALCKALQINGPLIEAARVLDKYYLTARYPDSLPGGAPHEAFVEREAREAVAYAEKFLEAAAGE